MWYSEILNPEIMATLLVKVVRLNSQGYLERLSVKMETKEDLPIAKRQDDWVLRSEKGQKWRGVTEEGSGP